MTLRIALSIVPYGIEDDAYQIDIWNLGKGADGKCDYAAVQPKHDPFRDSLPIAEDKGLVQYDSSGRVIGVKIHDDEDIRTVRVYGHDRASRDAYDLLYQALVMLGYRERNPNV